MNWVACQPLFEVKNKTKIGYEYYSRKEGKYSGQLPQW